MVKCVHQGPEAGLDWHRLTLCRFLAETHYSYTPSYARAVRGRRGDDVRAERCPRVGRDQAALRDQLGVHVVDFPFFWPTRESSCPRLESTIRALARQRGVVV